MANSTSNSLVVSTKGDDIVPALLEFQSPCAVMLNMQPPRFTRMVVPWVAGCFFSMLLAGGLIHIDKVVTATGKVTSQAPSVVEQQLDTSIVRSIDVKEGQIVKAGDILARLDPTFAAADLGALAASVGSLDAEVQRERAEVDGKPFTYNGTDPNMALQAAIYAQRQSERSYKIQNYDQKISSLTATIQRSVQESNLYGQRLQLAVQVESMRKQLQAAGVGSLINSLAAMDSRIEIQRGLDNANQAALGATRDRDALVSERDGYDGSWRADAAQKLAESARKLSDAQEQLKKANLRRQLVQLRAETDATVLSISRVAAGSVVQSGDTLITLVPLNAPLEVEANISGADQGFIRVGNEAAVMFDTFDAAQYGLAHGTVNWIANDSTTAADEARSHTPTSSVPLPQGSLTPYYRARVSLDKIELHNLPTDAYRLIPGMPVTVDIKVGTRTILGYLMGKISDATSSGMREP